MRHTLLTISAVLALAVLASPVDAQVPLKFGAQGAVITSVDDITTDQGLSGTFGLGGRVMLDPPLFPLGVIGSATYYFPDIDEFTYWTATAAAQLRLPLPVVKPYVLAGWQLRRSAFMDESSNENGPTVGAGIQLDLGMSVFLEGTFEFNEEITGAPDFDNNPLVIKGGVLFGG
jgi:opacity protein-like surface antigen